MPPRNRRHSDPVYDLLVEQGRKLDTMTVTMTTFAQHLATVMERTNDLPEIRGDVQSLKRTRAWLVGILTPAGAASGGMLGYFKFFGGGQ